MRLLLLLCLVLPVAGVPPARTNELSTKDLTAARKIYVAKCAKCHRFYEPQAYDEASWRLWMERMNLKSKLKLEQADLLNRYLDAYRAGGLPGKPQDKPKPALSPGAGR